MRKQTNVNFSDGTARSNLSSHELHHTCMQVCKCVDMQVCKYNTFQRELFGTYMCTTASFHTEPTRGDRDEVSDDARIQNRISAEIEFWNVGRCVRKRQVHLALGTVGRSFSGLGFHPKHAIDICTCPFEYFYAMPVHQQDSCNSGFSRSSPEFNGTRITHCTCICVSSVLLFSDWGLYWVSIRTVPL